MKFWVGVTDTDWFEQLRSIKPVEVNFWQPSGRRPANLAAGTPFLFKLHSPRNFIVGGGYFLRFSALPLQLAWEAFGINNGTYAQSSGTLSVPAGVTYTGNVGYTVGGGAVQLHAAGWGGAV